MPNVRAVCLQMKGCFLSPVALWRSIFCDFFDYQIFRHWKVGC